MHIDNSVLKKLEKLSHITINDDKKDEIIEQLSNIVSYVENLNEIDTSDVEESFSVLKGSTPLREDVPSYDKFISKSILANAPQSNDDFFIVPAIIE
jgi:aspartyl-tRNA(Asn)/glutamyl-tRNA(Gln) amidotransferase subunit C